MDNHPYLTKLENYTKATKLVKEMLASCMADLQSRNIPIQADLIKGIYLTKIKESRACCNAHKEADGSRSFTIYISDLFANHLDNATVEAHVKNSIYHELLHTCPDAFAHNAIFLKWSKACDEAFGTHTLRHMERTIYYNIRKKAPIIYECTACGTEYYGVTEKEDVPCEFCSRQMQRRLPSKETTL